ncbi:hypothetical protein EGW08_018457, partial [Elysia chlorotica]
NVTKVAATDKDGTAPNNRIMFTLDQASQELFTIDSNTGLIKTWAGLDYEMQPSHLIEVIVTDLGSPTNLNSCHVKVHVSDVNDVPPKFNKVSIHFYNFSLTLTLIGLVCWYLYAKDKDSPGSNNSKIVYSLEAANSILLDHLRIHEETGEVTISKPFDYEALVQDSSEHFQFSVLATDMGTPAQSAIINVSLIVADVNDESPEFTKASYSLSIPEDTKNGGCNNYINFSYLYADEAGTDNSRVSYSISRVISASVTEDSFQLNKTTGELQVTSPLDFESLVSSYGEFLVEVVASDSGNPPLRSMANITVRVLDENDETPQFLNDTYTASVPENSPEGKNTLILSSFSRSINSGFS